MKDWVYVMSTRPVETPGHAPRFVCEWLIFYLVICAMQSAIYPNKKENGRLAPARVAQAEQPWGSIRRDGLPAHLGAHWEGGLQAPVR